MNIEQTSIDTFSVGHGTANETPTPIIAAGYAHKSYKGVTIRATSGTVYVGPRNVTTEHGYELPSGSELTIPVDDPSAVFVCGSGDYSWIAA